jgi:hypothetical protein
MDANLPSFVFFLTLDDQFPDSFYFFDRNLRELDCILVPVKMDQLQTLVATSEQEHVMILCSVNTAAEYKLYNEKVRGLLKFVLKSKRISFMHLSSFSKLNDSKHFSITRNYFFVKYPVDARVLSERIVSFLEQKANKSLRWPGGTRTVAGVV